VADEMRHLVCRDALPRLRRLFAQLGIKASLFVVGRDLEDAAIVEELKSCLAESHQVANHSYSHRLDFRSLSVDQLRAEISDCDRALTEKLGVSPKGFRAPGYGFSMELAQQLAAQGYRYDSSLMPGPYGSVFRWMDGRMQKLAGGQASTKTQYSRLADSRYGLAPRTVAGELVEIPAATSPLLRLPFQAGVCMRLGRRYFETNLRSFRKRPELPLLFLMHAADIADFSAAGHPFFSQVPYFSTPVAEKYAALSYFLARIREVRTVQTTEEWLASGTADALIRAS
jgi:hypothetical protein